MSNENQSTKKPLNPDDLNQFIVNARSSFKAYSQGVSSAPVNVYFLWRDTQASGATREGRDWITGVIAKRNEEIKKHNDSVKAEKKYVDDYKKGKLSKDELVNQAGKNKEEKELIAAEKKRLDDLVKKDDKYWDAQKLVPIEKRFGASIFTEIVKYVFEFDKPSHASMINRFCLGLEWIHARFAKAVVTDVNDIIAEIDRAGGFEIAVEDQRLVNNSDNTLSEDREIIAKRNYEDTKGALIQAQSLGSVPIEARHDQ